MILLFAILTVTLAASYAIYRFSYWSSIEQRVGREEVGTAEYDEKVIERILKEFKDKKEEAEALMGVPLPQSSEPAETRKPPAGSGDASPALGE